MHAYYVKKGILKLAHLLTQSSHIFYLKISLPFRKLSKISILKMIKILITFNFFDQIIITPFALSSDTQKVSIRNRYHSNTKKDTKINSYPFKPSPQQHINYIPLGQRLPNGLFTSKSGTSYNATGSAVCGMSKG